MQPTKSLRRAIGITGVLLIACAPVSASAHARHARGEVCAASRKHRPARHAQRRSCVHARLKPHISKPAPVPGGAAGATSPPRPTAAASSPTRSPLETAQPPSPAQQLPPNQAPPAAFHFFSPSSFWNLPLPEDAPLDPSSAEIVNAFSAEIATDTTLGLGPWINTTSWSVPVYTVPANQPTVPVALEPSANAPALQAAWRAVPLPPEALPASGNEKVLVVWQPGSDRLWEFWRMTHDASGWHAHWGGAMQNVSSDPGFYGSWAWPEGKSGWGVSASSLELLGGLISLEDLARGQIDHAIAIAIPNVRAGVYASPAQRTDGASASPLSLPEGAHLRLDPHLDLQAMHLPHITMMIAQAAQRYGLVVRDHAPNLSIYAQDPTPTGGDPYAGPQGYLEGRTPRALLAGFPWSHLQLLDMDLHSSP
jgi:hypothetical protein